MAKNPVGTAAEGILAILFDILMIPILVLGSLVGGLTSLRQRRNKSP